VAAAHLRRAGPRWLNGSMSLRTLSLLAIGSMGISIQSCSLITTEVEVDVKISGEVTGSETDVFDNDVIDLLTIDDYKNNIDKIKQGEVYAFLIRFTRVHDDNRAAFVSGRVNVRWADSNDPWIEGVAKWTPVYLGNIEKDPMANNRLNEIYVEPDPTTVKALNRILFANPPRPVEFQVEGFANDAPVHFDYEVTAYIRLKAKAG
jgi:hypothetical protein